jgi:multidrug resistance efflux pump
MFYFKRKNLFYLLLAVGLLLSGCAKTQEEKELKENNNNITISLDAAVYPMQKQEVVSAIGGYIKKIYVKNGDRVKAGDILYSLDKHLVELDIRDTKKEIAYLEQIRNNAREGRNAYIPAINLAASELSKVSDLRAEGYTNSFDENNYKKNYMNAVTGYKNNEITTYEKVKNLDVNIMNKRTYLEKLQYQVSHSDGYATVSGFVASLSLTEGQSVNVDTKVCSVVDIDTVIVRGGFATGLLPFITKNQKVDINFVTTPPYHVVSVVNQVNPIVDSVFKTMTVEMVVPNHNYLLQEGTRALVTISLSKKGQAEVKKYFMNKNSKESTFQVESDI